MNTEKYFKIWLGIVSCKSIVLMSLCLFLSSCTCLNSNTDTNQEKFPFIGNWQGHGNDSEGNGFTFVAQVSHLGKNTYRLLILDRFDTPNKPIHVMDGILDNNKFTYTSDEGLYEGGGMLSKDLFEGYYKGPVDGTYRMWRTHRETETK